MSPYYQKLRKALGTGTMLVPCVAAVIHDERRCLLLQRKRDGTWSLPAGAIEPGESPEQAMAREILEETGMRCTGTRILGVFGGPSFRHTYPNGDTVEYVVTLYKCTAIACGPILDHEETVALRYFSSDDCPALVLPYHKNLLFDPA